MIFDYDSKGRCTLIIPQVRASMYANKVRFEPFYFNKIIYCAHVKIELPELPNIKEVQVRNFYKLDLSKFIKISKLIIKDTKYGYLPNFPKLKKLILDNNNCINFINDTFLNLKYLYVLFHGARIHIPENLVKLKKIHLSEIMGVCVISEKFINLEILILNNVSCYELPRTLTKLKKLDVMTTHILSIPETYENLEILCLSRYIRDVSKLKKLREIHIRTGINILYIPEHVKIVKITRPDLVIYKNQVLLHNPSTTKIINANTIVSTIINPFKYIVNKQLQIKKKLAYKILYNPMYIAGYLVKIGLNKMFNVKGLN